MASLLKIAGLFLTTLAFASCSSLVVEAAGASGDAAVLYTTGGQGFHRQLLVHFPLRPSPASEVQPSDSSLSLSTSKDTHSSFSVTLSLRLRNTFFIDVAEAENQWDSRVIVGNSAESLATEFKNGLVTGTSPSRGGAGFVDRIALQHPISTLYPFDIEIPTVKSPYLYNTANVTFDIVVDNNKLNTAAAPLLAVLSIPIHERYEDVTTDPSVTHVQRCIEASDVRIYVNEREGDERNAPLTVKSPNRKASSASIAKKKTARFAKGLTELPIRFTQSEDTVEIIRAAGLGGGGGRHDDDGSSSLVVLSDAQFCVRVPVGFLGDLPFFYWATMSMMVIGATAVWAGLTFV